MTTPPAPPGGDPREPWEQSWEQSSWQQPAHGAPSAPTPTQDERTWALASHIGCLLGAWLAMAFLVPLVIMLVKGDGSAFVRHHAVESLNFQLSMLIYLFASIVLAFVLVGLLILPVLGVLWLVFVIIATVKASNGEPYRYPLTIRFVK